MERDMLPIVCETVGGFRITNVAPPCFTWLLGSEPLLLLWLWFSKQIWIPDTFWRMAPAFWQSFSLPIEFTISPGQWCDPWSKGFGRDLANGVAELWRGGAGGWRWDRWDDVETSKWGRISLDKMARVQNINTNHRSFLKKGVSELDAFQWRKTGHNKLFFFEGQGVDI